MNTLSKSPDLYRIPPLPLALRIFLGLLLALVPAGLVQLQMEREAREDRTTQVGEQATRLVSLVARQQFGTLLAAQQTLAAMTAHRALIAMRPSEECNDFLTQLVQASPRYYAANLFDLQGRAVCSTQPGMVAADVSGRRYFRAALAEGGFQVGDYAVGPGDSRAALHLASPLMGADGSPRGVVMVALSLDWLLQDLQALALPPGSAATIADRDGRVLARSVLPERFVGLLLPDWAMALVRATAPGLIDAAALDGVRRVAAYMPSALGPGGLFVTVGLDFEEEVAAAVGADRRAAIMIVGSLMLSFLAALVFFHTAIERPVQRLLATAQRWGREEWDARVGRIGGGREFQRLANAFDTMAEAVLVREAARERATTRMIAVQDVAPQIVLTGDAAGNVDWTNPYWRDLTNQSIAESQDDGWLEALHPEDRGIAAAAWHRAVVNAASGIVEIFDREVRIRRHADQHWRWFLLRGAPVQGPDGRPRAWTAVGIDVQALRDTQAALSQTAARLRATYENAPAGLCLLDRDLRFLAVNEMLARCNTLSVEHHLGRTVEEAAPHVAPKVVPALRQVLATGQPVRDLEITGQMDDESRTWLCNYHPVWDASGQVTGVSGAVIDITARRRVEERERLLAREVDHRAQNALAVVRGLVRLSAAEAPDDVPAMIAVLEGRIGAMSRVHTVLSRENWAAADLREIVLQELAPHAGRALAEGPALRLRADAAQPLSLVMHELVTNAAKYGGLSTEAGQVTLRWAVEGELVVMHWVEQGGPRLSGPPAQAGFGSMLIEANLHAPLAGDITRDWRAEGLRCVITFSTESLATTIPYEQAMI